MDEDKNPLLKTLTAGQKITIGGPLIGKLSTFLASLALVGLIFAVVLALDWDRWTRIFQSFSR